MGVTEGCEVESGAGEEAVEEAGPVLHPFQPGLYQGGELADVAFGQVGQGSFQAGPGRLDLAEFVRIRRALLKALARSRPPETMHRPALVGVTVMSHII